MLGWSPVPFRVIIMFKISGADQFHHMLLSDLIPKNIQIKFTKVSFHKGQKSMDFGNKVRFDKQINMQFKHCQFVMIFVGINDLMEIVKKDRVKQVTIHNIMARYASLHQVICGRDKHATILVSSILPHANSFDLYFL